MATMSYYSEYSHDNVFGSAAVLRAPTTASIAAGVLSLAVRSGSRSGVERRILTIR